MHTTLCNVRSLTQIVEETKHTVSDIKIESQQNVYFDIFSTIPRFAFPYDDITIQATVFSINFIFFHS